MVNNFAYAKFKHHLLHKKLCITVCRMDPKDWFSSMAKRRITVTEIGDLLGVSRNTARTRMDNLSADDVITISRALHLSPIHGLVELGYLSYDEVFNFLDGGGQLVATADDGDLALELARRLNPATVAPEIDELAARRSNAHSANVQGGPYDDGTVREWDPTLDHAADSSPDEQEERENRGEDPVD